MPCLILRLFSALLCIADDNEIPIKPSSSYIISETRNDVGSFVAEKMSFGHGEKKTSARKDHDPPEHVPPSSTPSTMTCVGHERSKGGKKSNFTRSRFSLNEVFIIQQVYSPARSPIDKEFKGLI